MTGATSIRLPGGDAVLFEDAVPDADAAFRRILDETPWRQEKITLFGRERDMPRLTCWMGEAAYVYSGLLNAPAPWSPAVAALKATVETLAGASFNGVLLNLYRDGADSMGWHADDETELGPEPVIASVSLGAVRRMRFKPKRHHRAETLGLDLPGGSVLVMRGGTQQNWLHAVSKTARPVGPRINLTFRRIVGV